MEIANTICMTKKMIVSIAITKIYMSMVYLHNIPIVVMILKKEIKNNERK